MRTEWQELLEAVIAQIEELRGQGVTCVNVSPETLEALVVARPLASLRDEKPQPAAPESRSIPLHEPQGGARSPSSPDSPATRDSRSRQDSHPPRGGVPGPEAHDPNMEHQFTSPPALEQGAKSTALAALREQAMTCQKCPHLARSRKSVVFGVGDINAALMFVGEAPGADEDAQGEPFVGAAGQLLTRMIGAMGFTRETVYIANILKCRPDTPGQASGNRKPTSDEMRTCLPYLLAQIELIQPKVIVALGATALEGLLGLTESIGRLRGRFQVFRGVPVMPTYHPSYLLRSEARSVKRLVWEDMLQVLEKLNVPITEKQRSYFLRGA
ncbi:MAG: uracil-DNA glycosylase [Verrucomicrobia bacterium]|nr:uracil-DNA glycosylase [Verrucomicrobiota bacterium]